MIEPSSSWISQRESAWQPHSFNYLTVNAAPWQPEHMPTCVDSHYVSAYMGSNGHNVCGTPADKGVKIKDGWRFEQNRPFPNIRTSLPTMNTYSNKHLLDFPSGNDRKETPYETSYSQQKKFLIFDRSGEETRMVLSCLCSPICNGATVNAFKSEKSCPKLPDLSEDSGENHLIGEGSDYHEDTEEINALLYSSDDDIDGDEDEISTGRSPNAMDDGFNNAEEGEDFDEVSSLWCSSKRQKLLEGGSNSKMPSMETKSMTKSATRLYEDESVVNLSLSWKRKRMHKIHGTLRVLQKLVPDSKTQDPLVIIDETISYLKSLKDKSQHMEKADGSSWSTPDL